jgi:hypothetical protein
MIFINNHIFIRQENWSRRKEEDLNLYGVTFVYHSSKSIQAKQRGRKEGRKKRKKNRRKIFLRNLCETAISSEVSSV